MTTNVPCNVWLVHNMSEFNEMVMRGVKVILIAESPDPYISNNPSCVPASVLLPQYESVSALIDGDEMRAEYLYIQYLNGEIAQDYISVIVAAAVKSIPIGIMFEDEEIAQRFAAMFIGYLYNVYGLAVAGTGLNPGPSGLILGSMYDNTIALMYMKNLVDHYTYLRNCTVINPSVIGKLAAEQNPLVDEKDFQHYNEYFYMLANEFKKYNRMLIDPMEAKV